MNITKFFCSAGSNTNANQNITASVTMLGNPLQAVATALYWCYTETSALEVSSPVTQGFVSHCGVCMPFSSKDTFEAHLVPAFNYVCSLLNKAATSHMIGSLTVDGWNTALGASVLGMN